VVLRRDLSFFFYCDVPQWKDCTTSKYAPDLQHRGALLPVLNLFFQALGLGDLGVLPLNLLICLLSLKLLKLRQPFI